MNSANTLLTIVLTCIISFLHAQEYETNMQDIFTAQNESTRLQHVKSAVDKHGHIHLVFTANEHQLIYGTNQNGSWAFENLWYVDKDYNDTTDVAYYPNIAIDKNNDIHIAMFGRYQEKLYYAQKALNSKEFLFETIQISPEPLRFRVYGKYTDMAIDKNGGLHLICSADYTDKNELKYNEGAVYFNKPANADQWYLQVLVHDSNWDENNFRYGKNSSIACYDDKVFVALGGDNDLHFGTRNISGGTWDIENLIHTPENVVNSQKYMLSLAISPFGNTKFAFFDRSDDENAPWQGLTVFSQGKCGSKEWVGYNGWEWPKRMNCPAMAIDQNGKAFLALGQSGFALYEQSCDCDGEYKIIFSDDNNSADFVDMLIDNQNVVHTFFTSDYDNKLHYLTTKPKASGEMCNYPPAITGYTGKTNVGPGEEWTGTITASDAECDEIDFYSIILPEHVTIIDHTDGTATIKVLVPEGEGFGDVGFSVFIRDDKHQETNSKLSVITFMLKLTQEGNEKGYIKVENKCSKQQ